MRSYFNILNTLGAKQIEDTELPEKSRDELLGIFKVLKLVFTTKEYQQRVFECVSHLNKKVGQSNNGRPGMSLWEIVCLNVVRVALNTNYDRLHWLANYDSLLRQLMGVEYYEGYKETKQYSLTVIKENLLLLDEPTIENLNRIILEIGSGVLKKNARSHRLKTDTFVAKTNVHFPTDINLLWDALRKVITLCGDHCSGWRKHKFILRATKKAYRRLEKAAHGGGKNKDQRIYVLCSEYLEQAALVYDKVSMSLSSGVTLDAATLVQITYYNAYVVRLMRLMERRLLNKETIPHWEKIFSIFEPHTRWIVKGKAGVICELGQKMLITSDENDFIINWRSADDQSDVHLTQDVVDQTQSQYSGKILSHSFDKGFSKQTLNQDIKQTYPHTKFILQKKGKLNKQELLEETEQEFKTLRNKHNAVESNINDLMHCGLDICPDKGEANYKRYIALGVLTYNIKKLGQLMIRR